MKWNEMLIHNWKSEKLMKMNDKMQSGIHHISTSEVSMFYTFSSILLRFIFKVSTRLSWCRTMYSCHYTISAVGRDGCRPMYYSISIAFVANAGYVWFSFFFTLQYFGGWFLRQSSCLQNQWLGRLWLVRVYSKHRRSLFDGFFVRCC